ncbi:hypothetical protein IFM89_026371 [Coptis chinensis]|uniref:eIF3a PCI domain-containing protein n=1 Tax=Coptis chinensis TaxID=261450 RepID=A0A835IBC2_9MAGN|nr:hypothetical protein IFM89_026371 [Coptis chinensis]
MTQALEEALDVDDLEDDGRPEDLMLSYVSGEKGKDRSDPELQVSLGNIQNSSRYSSQQLQIGSIICTHHTFQFCKQYNRKTEFHRLCETIRINLANLNKYRDQRDRPDLSDPESLQLYMDTRFEQLKVATELGLWQKSPKASLLVIYYAKLTDIFWASDSHLFHAYVWLKNFTLEKSYNKKLTQNDLQLIASSIVLAALSVVPYNHMRGAAHLELQNEKERSLRMSSLIGFILDPKSQSREELSRSALLSELYQKLSLPFAKGPYGKALATALAKVSKGVMSCASQEVKDLYNLLERDFLTLDLASKVQPLLTKISKLGGKVSSASSVPEVQLSQYVPGLEKMATLRLLQQVSHVYQTIKIEALSRMIPFFDLSVVEKISVDAVKYNCTAVEFDHFKGVAFFGNSDLESDRLRVHLTIIAESLNKVRSLIYPPVKKASKLGNALPVLADIVDKEHKRLLARKAIIEKLKEEQERHMLEMVLVVKANTCPTDNLLVIHNTIFFLFHKERDEESKRLKLEKLMEEAEKKGLASDSNEREAQRIQREVVQRELDDAQILLEEVVKRSKMKGKKPVIKGEVTRDALIELARAEQLREAGNGEEIAETC